MTYANQGFLFNSNIIFASSVEVLIVSRLSFIPNLCPHRDREFSDERKAQLFFLYEFTPFHSEVIENSSCTLMRAKQCT